MGDNSVNTRCICLKFGMWIVDTIPIPLSSLCFKIVWAVMAILDVISEILLVVLNIHHFPRAITRFKIIGSIWNLIFRTTFWRGTFFLLWHIYKYGPFRIYLFTVNILAAILDFSGNRPGPILADFGYDVNWHSSYLIPLIWFLYDFVCAQHIDPPY